MWVLFLITTIIAASFMVYYRFQNWKLQKPLKSFAKFYDVTEFVPELELIRVDKLGNKWYGFKNIMQIPTKRLTDAEASSKWAELCMTPEMFVAKISRAQIVRNKDQQAAWRIIDDLKDRATWAAEEETLKMLAAQLYLIEGENPTVLTTEYLEKKVAIWNEDEDTKGFFLHLAYTTLRNLNELSEADFLAYLRDQQIKSSMRKMRQWPKSLNESLAKPTQQS